VRLYVGYHFISHSRVILLNSDEAHTKLNVEVAAILDDAGEKEPTSSLGRLLVPAIRDLLKVDHARGVRVLQGWRYWALNSESKDLKDFDNLDDYMQFRIINVGL